MGESAHTRQDGFTLIEISIVLVITGLILGGILVGRELIRSSELRSIITDLNKIQSAIHTFSIKYSALPGDMSNATDVWKTSSGGCPNGAGDGTCNGNGNGLLDTAQEPFRAWQQLAYAELIPGTFTGVTGPVTFFECDPGLNVPASRISGVGYSLEIDYGYFPPNAVPYLFSGDYEHYLAVGKSPSNWDTIEPAFTAAEMFSIDAKIDDGKPGTGRVVARTNVNIGGEPNCTDGDSTQGATAKYTVNTAGPACGFYFFGSW